MMSFIKFSDNSSEISFEKIKDNDASMTVTIRTTDSSNIVTTRSLHFDEKEMKELHSHLTCQLSKIKKNQNNKAIN